MAKEQFKMREALERIEAIKGRLNEMAENLESDKERESFTDAEKAESKELLSRTRYSPTPRPSR